MARSAQNEARVSKMRHRRRLRDRLTELPAACTLYLLFRRKENSVIVHSSNNKHHSIEIFVFVPIARSRAAKLCPALRRSRPPSPPPSPCPASSSTSLGASPRGRRRRRATSTSMSLESPFVCICASAGAARASSARGLKPWTCPSRNSTSSRASANARARR